jgi:hypothetical protein
VELNNSIRIGVEVTRLRLKAAHENAIAPEIFEVLKKAEQMYYEKAGVPIDVFFWKNIRHASPPALRSRERDLRAIEVASHLTRIASEMAVGDEEVISTSDEEPGSFPFPVDEITIKRVAQRGRSWSFGESSAMRIATRDEIEDTVASKADKPHRYERTYDQVWLLIHSGYERRGSNLARDITPASVDGVAFETPFHKVFVMTPSNGAIEVQVSCR